MVALALVTTYALWVGDRRTRQVGLIHAANWLLVGVLQPKHQHDLFPWGTFAVNIAGALVVSAFAVACQRGWMAVMAAFLVLGVIGYVNFLTVSHGWHRAYETSTYVWATGALAALAWGAWSGRARRKLFSTV